MSRLARLACALLLLLAAPLRAEEEQLSNGLACAPDLSAAGVRDYNAALARAFACMERQIRALTKENAALAERAEAAEQAAEQALEAAAAARKAATAPPAFRVTRRAFGNSRKATPIPGSKGAILCALSHVDDDTGVGACHIYPEKGGWMVRTGGNSRDQACTAVCLFAQ